MARIGHARGALLAALGAALGMLAALAIALYFRGFEIDDALISVRYARHLARGAGHRFNLDGAVTDGVTPLPWPWLLAPFARGADAMTVLDRAKGIALAAWLAAAGGWGIAVARARAHVAVKAAAFVSLAACVPVGAHAMSGMETGLAIALVTAASIAVDPWRASGLAGLAAALRPELAVWAAVLAAGVGPPRRALPRVALALVPFTLCAAARAVAFGHVAPLAVLAKPSDAAHGAVYAAAAALVSLAPVVAFSPLAYARSWDRASALGLAGVAHFAAIVAVGGDWMPFARLAAPVAPSLLYAFVLASPRASRALTALRVALALGLGGYVLAVPARRGRDVEANVRSLVERARPLLAPARRVAALDVGWPTAAGDADIVDLAGLTDPEIAALPGGHTSKRVDAAMLLARDPDVILLYTPRRVVEARLDASPLIHEHYEARAFLPYGDEGAGYDVLVRR